MAGLQVAWFLLIGVLLTGYALLDGFDLGLGFWYLFTPRAEDRRALLASIGPFWDGNEVWLLTGGGALFAAFPHVYATVFSGFYLALFLLVLCLILRAVAIEFRSQLTSLTWRSLWDGIFGTASTAAALLFGVALGNVLRGVPLDRTKTFTGNFFTLLNPYALLIGLTGFALLLTHGALYIAVKAPSPLAGRARRYAWISYVPFCTLLVGADIATLLTQSRLAANYAATPVLSAIPVGLLLSAAGIGFCLRTARVRCAFFMSFTAGTLGMAQCACGLFPALLPCLGDPSLSLTIYNSSSTQATLLVMLLLAVVGMPVVIGYTVWAHRVFSHTKEGEAAY